jgi:hypothetical protein
MYEMEGASSGSATPRPTGYPANPGVTRRPPVPKTRVKCRFPGSSRFPGSPPGGSRSER